jgi:hypothetical protein
MIKLLNGWKAICEYTGFSRRTLLKLIKNQDFPIVYIAGKPCLTEQSMNEWFANFLKQRNS